MTHHIIAKQIVFFTHQNISKNLCEALVSPFHPWRLRKGKVMQHFPRSLQISVDTLVAICDSKMASLCFFGFGDPFYGKLVFYCLQGQNVTYCNLNSTWHSPNSAIFESKFKVNKSFAIWIALYNHYPVCIVCVSFKQMHPTVSIQHCLMASLSQLPQVLQLHLTPWRWRCIQLQTELKQRKSWNIHHHQMKHICL